MKVATTRFRYTPQLHVEKIPGDERGYALLFDAAASDSSSALERVDGHGSDHFGESRTVVAGLERPRTDEHDDGAARLRSRNAEAFPRTRDPRGRSPERGLERN